MGWKVTQGYGVVTGGGEGEEYRVRLAENANPILGALSGRGTD